MAALDRQFAIGERGEELLARDVETDPRAQAGRLGGLEQVAAGKPMLRRAYAWLEPRVEAARPYRIWFPPGAPDRD